MITPSPNAKEVQFNENELIVSKTDLKGNITYANRIFMKVSNFSTEQIIGKPHNIIRHPDMPKGVFYGLWKTLKSGNEFFGFVKNITADGHYYWVFANITPDYVDGKMVGFYSVRRSTNNKTTLAITNIYKEMLSIEKNSASEQAAKQSWEWLNTVTKNDYNKPYEEFVLSLYEQ